MGRRPTSPNREVVTHLISARLPRHDLTLGQATIVPHSATNNHLTVISAFAILIMTFSWAAQAQVASDNIPPLRWWKGNLHTHSLWSDGDDFPEMIAQWYCDRGYNFLALSDHNVLSQGMKWMPLGEIAKRGDEGIFERYVKRFGSEWVETQGKRGEDGFAIRLKPWDEIRCLFEQPGRFILIPGEEISDKAEGKPVHINATNILEVIKPLGGLTVRESMENNLRAVLDQEQRTGRQILAHLNHPNFHFAITAEDLASVISERFFEVYNGHPEVHHLGDETHPSVERMWDVANAIRLIKLAADPLMGVATDDTHEYHGRSGARPGRGWVMVQSRFLTPEHLIRAMKRGDFYCSSGVALEQVDYDDESKTLSLSIRSERGATYKTQFIATIKANDAKTSTPGVLPAAEDIGRIVATSDSLTPSYKLSGNEYYVRAVVTSSLPPVDPSFDQQKEQAWSQPVGWRIQ